MQLDCDVHTKRQLATSNGISMHECCAPRLKLIPVSCIFRRPATIAPSQDPTTTRRGRKRRRKRGRRGVGTTIMFMSPKRMKRVMIYGSPVAWWSMWHQTILQQGEGKFAGRRELLTRRRVYSPVAFRSQWIRVFPAAAAAFQKHRGYRGPAATTHLESPLWSCSSELEKKKEEPAPLKCATFFCAWRECRLDLV